MSDTGTPTLDQLHVLTTVVEAGSFSAAARRLHRAQSVISYTIANLEAQLGVALFARDGRRPVLTEAGVALIADARRIGRMVDEMRARAAALRQGLEAELGLAVDVMFPTARLVAALDAFARAYPTVGLRLRIEGLGGVARLVLDRSCQLGVSGWMGEVPDMLERRAIGEVRLIPVAAPTHPVAGTQAHPAAPAPMPPAAPAPTPPAAPAPTPPAAPAPTPIDSAVLREHVQLVLTDRTAMTEGQDFGVLALRTWRLGDLGAKHALLLAGLGWGNMPAEMVRDDLAAGRLVQLQVAAAPEHHYPISLIHRTDSPPGPAGAWLAERLAAG
jgi:DNA-binding transcriptional LysR family regulator